MLDRARSANLSRFERLALVEVFADFVTRTGNRTGATITASVGWGGPAARGQTGIEREPASSAGFGASRRENRAARASTGKGGKAPSCLGAMALEARLPMVSWQETRKSLGAAGSSPLRPGDCSHLASGTDAHTL